MPSPIGGRTSTASGEGTTEIIVGILMTLIGFGSILFDAPVICCGFAIFGPILFLVGLFKALRSPSRPAMYYPPYGGPPPYYPGAPSAPSTPPGPGAPAPPEAAPTPPPALPAEAPAERKPCGTCGADNRGDAKFCTSCGAPF